MRLVMILMRFAPYGVFCLIAKVFAAQGFDAIAPLARYFVLVLGVLVAHALFTYPFLLRTLGRLDRARATESADQVVSIEPHLVAIGIQRTGGQYGELNRIGRRSRVRDGGWTANRRRGAATT